MKAELEGALAAAAAQLRSLIQAGQHDIAQVYAKMIEDLHAIWSTL